MLQQSIQPLCGAPSAVGPHVRGRAVTRRQRYSSEPRKTSTSASQNGDETSSTSSVAQSESPQICIIEANQSGTIRDFEQYDSVEIAQSIQSRRTRIFLLMEEVRRLRIEQRLKGGDVSQDQELAEEKFNSALPFLPPLEEKTLEFYYRVYAAMVGAIILFGGLVAPVLEVKLGLGGTSYVDFVNSMNLPSQLADVDPIVASFCGGGVGVLSALLIVEENNIKKQQKTRCFYCKGTGYLMCGNCIGSGLDPATTGPCTCCARSGKVMCTGCLCTGKHLATEHDPRIDPFD